MLKYRNKINSKDVEVIINKIKTMVLKLNSDTQSIMAKKKEDNKTYRKEIVNNNFAAARMEIMEEIKDGMFKNLSDYLKDRNSKFIAEKTTSFKTSSEQAADINKYMMLFGGKINPKVIDLLISCNDIEALESLKAYGELKGNVKIQIDNAIDEAYKDDKAYTKTKAMIKDIEDNILFYLRSGFTHNLNLDLDIVQNLLDRYKTLILNEIGEETPLFEDEEFYSLKDFQILAKIKEGPEREAMRIKTNILNNIQEEHNIINKL